MILIGETHQFWEAPEVAAYLDQCCRSDLWWIGKTRVPSYFAMYICTVVYRVSCRRCQVHTPSGILQKTHSENWAV